MKHLSEKYKFSFIVIGKNEGWKLSLCFQSILNCIEKNRIDNYEIIYVDSRSTDDSIERAKKIPNIKIFSIIGKCNAAIARNIGGKEAQGDILFFLDGDMELNPDFITFLFNEKGKMIHPFMSGIVCNYNYNKDWTFINKESINSIQKNVFKPVTGGFFIITKDLWTEAGGMDTRLTANEDLDLGLRLAKKGFLLLLMAKAGVNHHTITILNSTRGWQKVKLNHFCAILARKHLFNNQYYTLIFFRKNYSAILLMISILTIYVYPASMIVYLLVILIRAIKRGLFHNYMLLPFFIVRDFIFLYSLFFTYPPNTTIKYRIINIDSERALTADKYCKKLN